jgi:hypothetical protein
VHWRISADNELPKIFDISAAVAAFYNFLLCPDIDPKALCREMYLIAVPDIK